MWVRCGGLRNHLYPIIGMIDVDVG
jgi:hypothetical protein